MQELSIKHWTETQLDEATVGKAWAQDGFDCAMWVDPPGQKWLDFVHATDERVLVKDGIIEIEVEGARALLNPGDEAFIPAGCRHSVYNCGRTVARWFYGYRRLC